MNLKYRWITSVETLTFDKPPRCLVPWRLDFDTAFSPITTLIPRSPLSSRPHSWLPSTNPPYFTLASLHFLSPSSSPLSFPYFSAPPSFPLSTHSSYNMPIIRPYSCYIGLYCTISSCTGFATRDNAKHVTLGLRHNADSKSCSSVFYSPRMPLITTTFSIFARRHFSPTFSFSYL